MTLFTAIMSTFFGSLSDIFFKKALKYKVNLWHNDFLWQIFPLLVFLFAYYYIDFQFDTKLNLGYQVVGYIFLSFIVYTMGSYFHAKVFKVEKITHLLPYENLSKIFTILFSYVLFSDISFEAFLITLLTIFLIMAFSIDMKHLTFSKNMLLFSFSHFLFAIGNLMTGYILLEAGKGGLWVSGYSFITTYLFMGTAVFIFPFFIFSWFWELKNVDMWFYLYSGTSWFLSWFSWFLSLVVISYLGLSISVLLSFLWILSTLFFAFFILSDIPSKSDIFLTISLLVLMSMWFYLK